MVTIKDIAREAGVSISTVSFAYNGSAPVAPETKERILEIIKRLNYQPSSTARGLVTQKTNNLCLFTPHPGTDFFNFSGNSVFADLLQGIGETIDRKGYNLLIAWNSLRDKTPRALQLARQRAVDGILFASPSYDPETIRELTELKTPFVLMGRHEGRQAMNTVDIDNFDASYRNTRHLISLGHERIAFISPGPLEFLVCADRLDGYREALAESNLRCRDDYVFIGDDRQSSGQEAMRHFWSLADRPSGIVAGRDVQALGVLKFARENGLSLPGDIAMVSFENSSLAEENDITSITTNLYEIGKESARLLFKIMGRKKDSAPQNIVLPSELVVRSSCGARGV